MKYAIAFLLILAAAWSVPSATPRGAAPATAQGIPTTVYISTNKYPDGSPSCGLYCNGADQVFSRYPTGHQYFYQYYDLNAKAWVVVGWVPEKVVTLNLPAWPSSH